MEAGRRPSPCENVQAAERQPGLSVLIADPDSLARRALRAALALDGGIAVATHSTDPEAVCEAIEQLRPDVALVGSVGDAEPPLALIRAIAACSPATRVVVIATGGDSDAALPALRAGASGYLARDVAPEALPRIVRGVARGEAAVSRATAARLADELRARVAPDERREVADGDLDARERYALSLMATDLPLAELASRLGVAHDAARELVRGLMARLGVRTRTELVRAARAFADVEATAAR